MYEKYWRLDDRPFEPGPQQQFYYPDETHEGAMLKLRYAVENRRAAALLAGPSGSGKTMLVDSLMQQLAEEFSPRVHLVFPQMPSGELLAYLADEMGAPLADPQRFTVEQSVRRIEQFLTANSRAGRHAVVAIDEAPLLAESGSLETMRLLLNFHQEVRPCMTLLLVGQLGILPQLARMPGLDERLSVKTMLRAFTSEETTQYIDHRLKAAGADRAIFDSQAIQAVHDLAHGMPGQINRLCDLVLLVGYAEQSDVVTADQVESVCEELVGTISN